MTTPVFARDTAGPLVTMRGVTVTFPAGHKRFVHAVDNVDLEIGRGEILGLIGESGSGKSTLGRAMLGLVPSTGDVRWKGESLADMAPRTRHEVRTRMQMVFQDPHSALNPRRTILRSIREPLDIVGGMSRAEKEARAKYLLERVGLNPEHGDRYPHQLSGGQKQRACIARALTTNPELIVCDESVAALDVALQAEILNLLQDLRDELGLSILFISHDLSVVTYLADRVAVMYLGNIVETGTAEEIIVRPGHPYSEALLSAQPEPLPAHARSGPAIVLRGEIPSPLNPPSGCRFHQRCPYAKPDCSGDRPVRVELSRTHEAMCTYAGELVLAGAANPHAAEKESR